MTAFSRCGALILPLALALAACGERGGDTAGSTVTAEEVASRASDYVKPEPGLYRTSIEILEVDIPNAPPQVREMMKSSAASNQTHEYCVTPQDVEKGLEQAIRKSQQGDCDYKKFEVAGGRIDAVMTCRQQGQTVDMTMSGSGTATSSDMEMTMKMQMPGVGESTIRSRSRSERIGDCPA